MSDKKSIIYIDLDDTICDYKTAFNLLRIEHPNIRYPQSHKGFYRNLKPFKDAISVFKWLSKKETFEVYILSAPSLYNPNSYSEKRLWVEDNLGFEYVDRLILSYHKNLLMGDFLIDDMKEGRGQENFRGKLIQFGTEEFKTWSCIQKYFK